MADLYGQLALCLPCFECFTCINLSVPLTLFIVEGRRGTESFNNRSLFSINHILLLVCLASPFKGKDSVWCSFVPWSLAGSWPNRNPPAVSENTAQATGLLPSCSPGKSSVNTWFFSPSKANTFSKGRAVPQKNKPH